MVRGGIEHPTGKQPPTEWWTQQNGRASSRQFREWLTNTGPERKRTKFNANPGHREDLGYYLRSSLEANAARLLQFLGYARWTGKEPPPAEGLWYRYEGEEFLLNARQGKVIGYKPDFHLWEDGKRTLWECKGTMDQRSKRTLRLMSEQHPELSVTLVTREELQARKAEALYTARRRGEMILEIPGWEGD